ncbi:MAG: phosphatidylglycerol lysyltransferase domain-containing protein, partial [Clostridia bacterium]|nr:phosphatidylglycerol lysyltransferase domain-containing protein [Clostridia bacterium]
MLKNCFKIEDKEFLDQYLYGFDYKTSGLTFTSLFMWQNLNNFRYEVVDDFLCISGNSHLEVNKPEPFLFPPLTKSGDYDPEKLSNTIDKVRSLFESKGYLFTIRLLPFHMIDIIEKAKPNEMEFISDRPNYDYVYKSRDLMELRGRKFHSKRNHLNHFKAHFDYEYIPLRPEMADECIEFNARLNDDKSIDPKEMELLKMEEKALISAFSNFDSAGYIGGAIKINGQIEAFTIGGPLGKKSLSVHVEKANHQIRGLYQAINNEFCKANANYVKYVNREEDMGLAGLRKAKMSYRPFKKKKK